MLSPRHRYNKIAPSLRLPTYIDGLQVKAVPDQVVKDMQLALGIVKPKKGGPKPNALIPVALSIYQQAGMRMYYDAMLFCMLNVERAADLLNERVEVMQVYADCFFDIEVFESPSWRIAYLDAVYKRDPAYAGSLRNMLTLDEDTLRLVSDKSKVTHVDPKTALETNLRLHHGLAQAFIQLKLETLVHAPVDSDEFKRFKELYHMSVTSANLVQKLSDTLLRYDLDKSKQNFMQEFAMNLTKASLNEFINTPQELGEGEQPSETII